MELPILPKLKDGEKFDFVTLANNVEQTGDYWEWWWSNKYEPGKFSRPEIISNDESILVPTYQKATADLTFFPEFFDNPLSRLLKNGLLPSLRDIPRETFRDFLLQLLETNNSVTLPNRPQVVFAGGGYGSGKTTTLNFLGIANALPVGLGHLVGVDVFKPLIPEFNLIKAVADGRASVTVQRECQELASDLFDTLVQGHKSFIWDSSMSNHAETLERLKLATAAGYEMSMVAVLTPPARAMDQAMHRAKQTRRFPHPEALPKSHIGFRQGFNKYVPFFDKIRVFAHDAKLGDDVVLIATKEGKGNALEVLAGDVLESALRP